MPLCAETALELGEALIDAAHKAQTTGQAVGVVQVGNRFVCVLSFDPDEPVITVADFASTGDKVVFLHR